MLLAITRCHTPILIACQAALLPVGCNSLLAADNPQPEVEYVSYEQFGAVGDGIADDLPAICAAHAFANERDLPVRSNPDATYHLGRQALTAIIATSTDWGSSQFIIDDSEGVDDHKQPLFRVESRWQPLQLKIERLVPGQDRLDLRPEMDCLVLVENANKRLFIRRGLNTNAGSAQQEVFILRKDGTIEGAIDWDYEEITRVEAMPIDPEQLLIRGGVFINIANQMRQEVGYNYWYRNIQINRSNTVVDGITMRVTGETDVGHPYVGFLNPRECANITFRNCHVAARKTYQTIGSAGLPVSMGSYGYNANLVVNFSMINCTMDDIHDRSRWGVVASNFMKNFLVEDSELSRVDVHMGVSGYYIIRRSSLGHAGLNAIGSGLLLVEDSTVHAATFITFRKDYGANWQGDVIVRNCRWVPPAGLPDVLSVFRMDNDGTHDFGYPCSMPHSIEIDGLQVDDSQLAPSDKAIPIFSDVTSPEIGERPFPYQLTKRMEVKGLSFASGRPPLVSDNPTLEKLIPIVISDRANQ